MKRNLYSILITTLFLLSCAGGRKEQISGADKYIETITGFTCEKAAVTDNGFLVIAIDATSDNYDMLASQFLDEAKNEGVTGLKGVMIVDSKNCQFQQGAVVGKRIGKAFAN